MYLDTCLQGLSLKKQKGGECAVNIHISPLISSLRLLFQHIALSNVTCALFALFHGDALPYA